MYRRKYKIRRLEIFHGLILVLGVLGIFLLSVGLATDSHLCWAADAVSVAIEDGDYSDDSDVMESGYFITSAVAANIADTHAKRVWDGDMARGKPFLLHKAGGTAFAYVFPYALNTTEFPSYDSIFKAVKTARKMHATADQPFYNKLENIIGSFGSVAIAVSRSNFPILVVRHSLHPYFLYFEQAADVARRRLNTPSVTLENIEFNGPHELYFNFSAETGKLKLHAYLLKTEEEIKPMVMPSEAAEEETVFSAGPINLRRKKAWEAVDRQEIKTSIHAFKWINHYTLIPVVQWTHWCVPTAATMTAGYWDHYGRQGTYTGYGRIIDYWFEHGPICQNNNVTNVPNFIDEMIAHTGGCSWAPGGLIGALNNKNGYNFSYQDIKGTAQNDWNWPLIVSEVNHDRPVVWGVGPVRAHAMAAFGYRRVGSQKFVVVYNTWGATASQQLAEYNYDEWSGAPNTKTGVGILQRGGGTGGNHAVLVYPRGGETVIGSTKISWFVWGPDIKWTNILFSSNGGKSWKAVHQSWFLQTKPGWNSYTAAFNKTTSKGRIRIRCFSSNFEYIAGEGSLKNFFVQGKPDLIPIPACSRDQSGRLIIRVKNQGAATAAASTTRVEFFPGGGFNLNFPSIAAGVTAEAPLPMPGTCWNPDCDYQIKVDIFNTVNESNEANNTGSGACFS